jgi:protein subunit release factor B
MKKRKHLFSITKKDFVVQTFKAGGKGGQHQNKTDSAVRIIHTESGAVGISRNDRSQHRNKKLALERLTKTTKFKLWIQRKVNEVIEGKTIEEQVEEDMKPENLKFEIKDNGQWSVTTIFK